MSGAIFDARSIVLPIPIRGEFGPGEVDALRRENLELRRMLAAIVHSSGQARLKLPFRDLRALPVDPRLGLVVEKDDDNRCWHLRVGILDGQQ